MNACLSPGCEGEAASGRWCSKHLNLHAPACARSKPTFEPGAPCSCPQVTFAPDQIAPYVVPYDCLFEGPLTDEAKRRGFRDIIFEPNPKQSPGAGAHLCAVPTCNVVAYDMSRCKRHQQEVDALAEPPALHFQGVPCFVDENVSQITDGGMVEIAGEPPAPDDNLPKACDHRGDRARCVYCGPRTPNTPEPAPKADPVDHPPHYAAGGIEAIDVIEAWGLGFCTGNAVKYLARAGRKPGADLVEDLKKARWYLDRAIAKAGAR